MAIDRCVFKILGEKKKKKKKKKKNSVADGHKKFTQDNNSKRIGP